MKTLVGEREELEAAVQSVRYRSDTSGYTVAVFQKDGTNDVFTAVGTLPDLALGERVRLVGDWTNDPKWGMQLRIDMFETLPPRTEEAMVRYIDKLDVPGIGKGTAGGIVARFGLKALTVAESEPERVARAVRGMTPKKAKALAEAITATARLRDLMLFLERHGLGARFAERCSSRYGERAIEMIEEDPYRLARDIWGVGFHRADRVAESMGIRGEDPRRLRAGVLHVLSEASVRGDCYLPLADLLNDAQAAMEGVSRTVISEAIQDGIAEGLLHGEEGGSMIYSSRTYRREIDVANHLGRLVEAGRGSLRFDAHALADLERERDVTLADGQRAAVELAHEHGVTVVTGGPGTGKTTVTRFILDMLERAGLSLALCSPTGRAARRLHEASARPASTIHRLLNFDPGSGGFGFTKDSPLPFDVVLVDEMSMVDLWLFDKLIQAIRPGSRLILVGDANQLPSVGPGEVLRDMIRSGEIPTSRLDVIFRQGERSEIVTNAHRILHRRDPVCAREITPGHEFFLLEHEEAAEVGRAIVSVAAKTLTEGLGLNRGAVQVLAPMYKGDAGVNFLNEELQKRMNPPHPGKAERSVGRRVFRDGDRVIQLRNDYQLGIFNGEMGVVEDAGGAGKDMTVLFDELVEVPPGKLEQMALAYAVTVHKSQGSEYDWVVMPMTTQHAIMLNRPILYTAITRARKGVVLVGSRRALTLAMNSRGNRRRYTTLEKRIVEKAKGNGGGS